jgi:hypothetical protein
LFRRVSNVRAFEKQLTLLNLLMDIVFNILYVHRNGGKGNGKWYHASTIKLFEVLQNFGDSLAHNFISKNLVGLTLNKTRSNFHKEGFVYCIVINEFTFCYKKLRLSMPIPFECGKDEMKCIELATWNRRLDMINGSFGF